MQKPTKNLVICIISVSILSYGCNRDSSNLIESTGTVEATEVDIRSEASGKILALYFDEGDWVKKGEVIAEIDHEKLDIELTQAKARLAETEAQLTLLIKGLRDKEVERACETLLESKVLLKDNKREYTRIQKLYEEEVVDLGSRDKAEAAYEASQKRYEIAKKNYEIALEGSRKEEIQAGEAVKEAAEAQVKLIERRIEDATVTIPIDGVISERYVELGELMSVGSLIATVIDLTHVWVMTYVSEKNLGKVKLGRQGKVMVDSFPHKEFIGKVTYISPEAEFTPKNIQTKEERVKLVFGVKIEVDNPDQELKPGMPADAVIETGK
ncbi:MAG: efflux RND transporter periplasmic adaptor subunit [Deltaproteobacteria bacterium]|nr:efflux RND transporter periplasmic adaptor subunit [Deltaproteobacteria bacterium]